MKVTLPHSKLINNGDNSKATGTGPLTNLTSQNCPWGRGWGAGSDRLARPVKRRKPLPADIVSKPFFSMLSLPQGFWQLSFPRVQNGPWLGIGRQSTEKEKRLHLLHYVGFSSWGTKPRVSQGLQSKLLAFFPSCTVRSAEVWKPEVKAKQHKKWIK